MHLLRWQVGLSIDLLRQEGDLCWPSGNNSKWQINLTLNFRHCLGMEPRSHILPFLSTSGWNLSALSAGNKEGGTQVNTHALTQVKNNVIKLNIYKK